MISRRNVLAGLFGSASAGLAGPVWAEGLIRPKRRPSPQAASEELVKAARLGGVTGFALADVDTGQRIEGLDEDDLLPPASVAKVITTLYALEKLGSSRRFATEVMAVGQINGDRLDGDLILSGGGDPTLDTDQLGDLVAALAATGVRRVTGRFLAHTGALPQLDRLSAEQPDHVGYNPGLSGLNLNFNRVHFEWRKSAGDWTVSMDARAERFMPPVGMARMQIVPRETPLFTLAVSQGHENWTVARAALGADGSRWLPVRQPGVYAAEVFQTLARAQGIDLPQAEIVTALPEGARRIVDRFSAPLPDVLRDMLRFSTNLTAESLGLAASGAGTLRGSGAVMTQWASRRLGMTSRFVDHSGLEGDSRVSAADLVRGLIAGDRASALAGIGLRGLLRDVGIRNDKGGVIEGHPVQVRAKSGTLNFVSGLAGFILPPSGRAMCFAVFSADVPRREALAMADREQPEGGIGWTKRARTLQGQLIRRWAEVYG